MLNYLAKRAIAAFGRRWNYDSGYLTQIVDEAGYDAVLPMQGLGKVGAYRKGVPASVYFAAKLTASIAADCGPCAQLVVSMASEAGVDAATLKALVAGDRASLGEVERLGFDLAKSTIAREPADGVREEILKRYGRRGLTSLAYGLVAAEAYPTFKYATGFGHACVRLRVGDTDLPRTAALAT